MSIINNIKQFRASIINANSQKKEIENAVKKLTAQIKSEHTAYRKEIKDWKRARATALYQEMPRRDLIQLLYNDIMGDAFIYGKWQNRKLRISNKQIQVTTDGVIDEDKTKLLQKLWFNQFVKDYIDTFAYGYNLMFPSELDTEGYITKMELVPRTNIVPETKEILKNVGDQKGYRFDKPPYAEWCLWLGNKVDLGLLDKAAPLWIFKKHSWQNWDEFEEMFGVPIRIAKVASQDKHVQNEVKKWLRTLGSAGMAMFPEGTDIDIIESKSRDAFNVFNEKRKAANEELSILIDGQFESSTATGSNAKAGVVIENTQGEITQDDATMTLFAINEVLLPFLINRGYPFTENDIVSWNDNKKSDPKDRLAIFKGVKDLGYNVDKEQIEKELDVKITDAILPKEAPPKNYIQNFKEPHSHKGCGAHLETYRLINAHTNDDLTDDELKLLRRLWKNKGNINWSYKEFMKNHGDLLQAVRKGYGEIDFHFDSPDHKTIEHFRANVHRFGSDKTQKQLYDLNKIIKDPKVDTFGKFFERAKKVFPTYKRVWAKTEWEQAHATSQAAARHNRYKDNEDIAPYWQYKTVADDRVRPEHWALHNKVFRKTDADAWRFLAPNGWKCRCDDIELIDYNGEISSFKDAVAADPDGWEKMKKSGHDVNWGDKKQVFTASQSYLKGIGIDPLDFQKMTFNSFGLKSVSRILKRPLMETKKFNFNKHTDATKMAKFETAENVPVWLDKKLFDTMDDDIKNSIPAVLKTPDEIFFYETEKGFVKNYFKHYKEGSIQATIEIVKDKNAKITDFVQHKNADEWRKGLLIYSPKLHIERQLALYNSYDDNYVKEFFNSKNGGFVARHKKHGKTEKKGNLEIGFLLAKKGNGIALMEQFHTKKFYDAEWNGVDWEFKSFKKYTNLSNSIDKALKEAVRQGTGNILLYINNVYKLDDIIDGIDNRVRRNTKIKFIALLFNDGRLVKFSRKQIENREFIKLLKK